MSIDERPGKVCADCKEYKEASAFYQRNPTGWPLSAYCRPCHSKRVMAAQARRRGDAPLRARNLTAGLPEGMKRCGRCGEIFPQEAFLTGPSGQQRSECRPCHNLSNAEWKAANRDKKLASDATYREANRDALIERQRRWREEHPEAYTEIHSRWKSGNKDAVNASTWRRRYAIKVNGGGVTVAEWQAIKARYSHRCLFCGRQEPEIRLCFDHVVPVSLGGPTTVANGQPLCKSCNSRKHRQSLDLRIGSPYDTRPDLPVGVVEMED